MRSLAAAALLAALAALAAARGHSYPRSGGHSGHGSHSYPHSNSGYSGNSYARTNTIPNTGYPSQNTRNHGYPPTHGLSGTGGSHTQHSPTGNTGNWGSSNNWNSDHSRTSTNHVNNNYHSTKHTTVYKNEVHNHYVYHPPQQIQYGNSYHPVYHGQPPVYVYQYRESGSRFDHLLTGLALYNLGKMSSHHHHHYDDYRGYNDYSTQSYHTRPGESCFIRVEKPDGQYDEGRIDCQIVTSFILDSPADTMNVNTNNDPQTVVNKVTTTNVVSNVVTSNDQAVNGPITTVNTTNVTTVTTVDALSEKGPSINVTPSMKCFVIHNLGTRRSKHLVDCGLLTAYADNSMRSATSKLLPKGSIVIVAVLIFRIL